jgi:hypothetical protein
MKGVSGNVGLNEFATFLALQILFLTQDTLVIPQVTLRFVFGGNKHSAGIILTVVLQTISAFPNLCCGLLYVSKCSFIWTLLASVSHTLERSEVVLVDEMSVHYWWVMILNK